MVLGLLFSGNAYAANEGSGPIKFPPKFEQRFKAYLNYVKNDKNYHLYLHFIQTEQTIFKVFLVEIKRKN